MSYQPLAYDDADTADTMSRDCGEAAARMQLSRRPRRSLSERAVTDAPSLLFEDNSVEGPKPTIEVSEAAYRLASVLD